MWRPERIGQAIPLGPNNVTSVLTDPTTVISSSSPVGTPRANVMALANPEATDFVSSTFQHNVFVGAQGYWRIGVAMAMPRNSLRRNGYLLHLSGVVSASEDTIGPTQSRVMPFYFGIGVKNASYPEGMLPNILANLDLSYIQQLPTNFDAVRSHASYEDSIVLAPGIYNTSARNVTRYLIFGCQVKNENAGTSIGHIQEGSLQMHVYQNDIDTFDPTR